MMWPLSVLLFMAAATVLSIALPIAGWVMGAMLLPMAAVISPFLLFGS